MKKYPFQYVFLIIFIIGVIYSPMAHAGGAINFALKLPDLATSVINSVTDYIINPAFNLITGAAEFIVGGTVCGITGGAECTLYEQSICHLTDLTQEIALSPDCIRESLLVLSPSDISSCQTGSSLITFYNDVGPHSADEQNSTVQIYRFTEDPSVRYWPWDTGRRGGTPYNDAGAQNAAVMGWMDHLDNEVGDALISPYDYNASSYFISNKNFPQPAPLVEAPYNTVCNSSGVCKILDQSIPPNKFIAYVAKTTAKYELGLPDKKVIYEILPGCPVGYIYTNYSNGYSRCDGRNSQGQTTSVEIIYFINYTSGRIPVTYNNYPSTSFYFFDADNKKILAIPKIQYANSYKDFQFEFSQSQNPQNLSVNYPIQLECPSGYVFDDRYGGCYRERGGSVVSPSSLWINYNGGKIPVAFVPLYSGGDFRTGGSFAITDSKGKSISTKAFSNSRVGTEYSCPANYTYDPSGRCINYSLRPSDISATYAIVDPIFQINDVKLSNSLLVSHPINAICPKDYILNDYGRCQQSTYYFITYYADPTYLINYNGGTISVVNNSIADASGKKYTAANKEFKIEEGLASSPKFSVNYPVSGKSFIGYNGGALIDESVDTSGKSEMSILVDKYTPAASQSLIRQGKLLGVRSGQPVGDTYLYSYGGDFHIEDRNSIVGPFKPFDSAACLAQLNPVPQAPAIIQQSCNSVTLQSADKKSLGIFRRVKGSNADFSQIAVSDFSASAIFKDTGLLPHTHYEYIFEDLNATGATQIPTSLVADAYTNCLPSCTVSSTLLNIAKYGSSNLTWQCAADTASVSCQIQSNDPKLNTRSGLNSSGSITISPETDSQYVLSCTNIDGTVTQPPVNVSIFIPGLKEIKP